MKINPEEVNAAFLGCLFAADEITDSKTPENAVIVEGIVRKFGFHPQRLEATRTQVTNWLEALPVQFHRSGGGGWSFLNACVQGNGEQWTGLHQRMEELVCLGIGLGLVEYMMPRDMWEVFPGGMPYLMVKL